MESWVLEQLFDIVRYGWATWVAVTVAPFGAHLERWGRTGAGEWFGMAIWWQPVSYVDAERPPGNLDCAGWFPAHLLRPWEGQDYRGLDRTWLGPDPTGWPRPQDRPGAHWPKGGVFLGVVDGGPLRLPRGVVARYQRSRREG